MPLGYDPITRLNNNETSIAGNAENIALAIINISGSADPSALADDTPMDILQFHSYGDGAGTEAEIYLSKIKWENGKRINVINLGGVQAGFIRVDRGELNEATSGSFIINNREQTILEASDIENKWYARTPTDVNTWAEP